MQTTLTDEHGVVHWINVPDTIHVPAHNRMRPVGFTALCGIQPGSTLPAYLAKQTHHPAFTGRKVTCEACRTV